MCDTNHGASNTGAGLKTIPVSKAVGKVLAHDITEIRPGEFKGAAFRKGHIVKEADVCHLQRLGKENLFVLELKDNEMHEDAAAYELARALMGEGVEMKGEPREGKINITASRDGLLKVDRDALCAFNMLGEVMCATLHENTVVRKGRVVAGTRAIPLVIQRDLVERAVLAARASGGVVSVKEMRRPKAGIVITGNEVYSGRIQDAFAPIIERKVREMGGKVVGTHFAPDDRVAIRERLEQLLAAGVDLLITTGGMSVDPDDVTRFAIRELGAEDVIYGSPVLPGAMFLVARIVRGNNGSSREIPILGIPACGMYHGATVFDIVLPRVLAGERIGRRDLAELGHGGLCLHCKECRYPMCPFGK